MTLVTCKEHETVEGFRERLREEGIDPLDLRLDPKKPEQLLGLTYDYLGQRFVANYYIGASWVGDSRNMALAVLPKMPLDFPCMFACCWDDSDIDVQAKLEDIYHIDLDSPPIPVQGMEVEIMPLIILHFAKVMRNLLKHGLKSDYVFREENLKGKVKGKLMFTEQIKRNVFHKRLDLNYCHYQEYSVDCIENRILKKALRFSIWYLGGHRFSNHEIVMSMLKSEIESFVNVSEEVSITQLKSFRVNPLYREYAQALKLAKMILRRFSYDISKVEYDNAEHLTPPFWINMPLLFELYVLSLLKRRYGKQIAYHITSRGNEIDFGKYDEKLIIDAKYIPAWEENVLHENLRQLAGYARNIPIRNKLIGHEDKTTVLPLLIIYASNGSGTSDFSTEMLLADPSIQRIPTYLECYKLGIRVPKTGGVGNSQFRNNGTISSQNK